MRKLLTILLLPIVLLAQGGGQTIDIPIQNPSFEQVSAFRDSEPCGTSYWFASSWNVGAGSRTFQTYASNPCGIALPPDGNSALLAGYGSQFSQTLTVTPAQLQLVPGGAIDGVYVLAFWVANYFPKYPGNYDVEVSFGTQQLCESYGLGTEIFTKVTMVCPGPQYIAGAKEVPGGGPVQGYNDLVITFTANYWELLFDNVSLTFTPQ